MVRKLLLEISARFDDLLALIVSQQQIGLRLCADFKLGTGGIPGLNQGGFICFVDVQQLIKIRNFVQWLMGLDVILEF